MVQNTENIVENNNSIEELQFEIKVLNARISVIDNAISGIKDFLKYLRNSYRVEITAVTSRLPDDEPDVKGHKETYNDYGSDIIMGRTYFQDSIRSTLVDKFEYDWGILQLKKEDHLREIDEIKEEIERISSLE